MIDGVSFLQVGIHEFNKGLDDMNSVVQMGSSNCEVGGSKPKS
jgi:hypothetical protein